MSSSLIKSSFNIYISGFGCCKQEIIASTGPVYDISRFGISVVSYPESADVLIVQGFLNRKYVKRLIEIYDAMKDPKWVMAYGKCAIENAYFESDDTLINTFKKKMNFDIYVPGCPPRPEAFIYAMLRLAENV
ncbi:MAG TPA: NADH-quinone oxidoreductase subunit NuoB [Actinobacteria bacterium]|nr:NADH-quinone oxidoreductase subunit NuoB [Actinomycetota bacterium]